MLLKTNLEKMSLLGLAIISMKIKGLFDSGHYVYEKNSLSPSGGRDMRWGSAPKPLWFYPLGRSNRPVEAGGRDSGVAPLPVGGIAKTRASK
jgi:hypothetical protein